MRQPTALASNATNGHDVDPPPPPPPLLAGGLAPAAPPLLGAPPVGTAFAVPAAFGAILSGGD